MIADIELLVAQRLVGPVLEVGDVARVGLARGGAVLRLKPQLDR